MQNPAERKVRFLTTGDVRLAGLLANPADDLHAPIVILCHGLGTGKESATNTELVRRLHRQGIATFRFDFFGHGDSGGAFEEITPSRGKQDVLHALSYLAHEGYSAFCLVGSSFGGYACAAAASEAEGLRCLALKCPVFEWDDAILSGLVEEPLAEWKRERSGTFHGRRLNYSFFEDAQGKSMYEALREVHVPVLIVHGEKDDLVPIAQSKKAAGILPGAELKAMPRANHFFEEGWDEMVEAIERFIVGNA